MGKKSKKSKKASKSSAPTVTTPESTSSAPKSTSSKSRSSASTVTSPESTNTVTNKTVTKTKVINGFSLSDLILYSIIPGGQNLARMTYYNSTTEQSFWMIPLFNLPIIQALPLIVMSQTMKISESKKTTSNFFKYVILLLPVISKIGLYKKGDKFNDVQQYLIMIAISTFTMLIYNSVTCGKFDLGTISKSLKSGVIFTIFPEIAVHLSERSKLLSNFLGKAEEENKGWRVPGLWIFFYMYLASSLAMSDMNENNCKTTFSFSSMIMVSIIAFLAYKIKLNDNEECSLF